MTKNAVAELLEKYDGDAYALLQLPIENDRTFRGFSDIHETVRLSDYELVYSGLLENSKLAVNYILEDLFEKFNAFHPIDYKARSMSVSDVVAIRNKQYVDFFFCDRYGFKFLESVNLEEGYDD